MRENKAEVPQPAGEQHNTLKVGQRKCGVESSMAAGGTREEKKAVSCSASLQIVLQKEGTPAEVN